MAFCWSSSDSRHNLKIVVVVTTSTPILRSTSSASGRTGSGRSDGGVTGSLLATNTTRSSLPANCTAWNAWASSSLVFSIGPRGNRHEKQQAARIAELGRNRPGRAGRDVHVALERAEHRADGLLQAVARLPRRARSGPWCEDQPTGVESRAAWSDSPAASRGDPLWSRARTGMSTVMMTSGGGATRAEALPIQPSWDWRRTRAEASDSAEGSSGSQSRGARRLDGWGAQARSR